ncbi:MAG: PAS domain S-box protein, partial [Chitinophagaceae bacterium]
MYATSLSCPSLKHLCQIQYFTAMKQENRYVDDKHFRKLADTVPAIFWITDKDGRCVFLNKRWFEITGQPEDESLGLGWTKKIHADDTAYATKTFIDANATAAAFQLLYRLQQKNGEYRWALDQGEPRYDNEGNFDGFTGTVNDVHEQVIANEKIKETEELFRIALESADMGTFDYYPQSGTVYWSTETKALFGLPPDAKIDHSTYKKGIHPEDLQKSTEASGEFNTANGGIYENEYRTIGITDGKTR